MALNHGQNNKSSGNNGWDFLYKRSLSVNPHFYKSFQDAKDFWFAQTDNGLYLPEG